jgi:hypothetical protein
LLPSFRSGVKWAMRCASKLLWFLPGYVEITMCVGNADFCAGTSPRPKLMVSSGAEVKVGQSLCMSNFPLTKGSYPTYIDIFNAPCMWCIIAACGCLSAVCVIDYVHIVWCIICRFESPLLEVPEESNWTWCTEGSVTALTAAVDYVEQVDRWWGS